MKYLGKYNIWFNKTKDFYLFGKKIDVKKRMVNSNEFDHIIIKYLTQSTLY